MLVLIRRGFKTLEPLDEVRERLHKSVHGKL
jgi:hypothetical protein